jgi:hypothetical protein
MDEVGKKNDNGQVASAPQGAEAADGGLGRSGTVYVALWRAAGWRVCTSPAIIDLQAKLPHEHCLG